VSTGLRRRLFWWWGRVQYRFYGLLHDAHVRHNIDPETVGCACDYLPRRFR